MIAFNFNKLYVCKYIYIYMYDSNLIFFFQSQGTTGTVQDVCYSCLIKIIYAVMKIILRSQAAIGDSTICFCTDTRYKENQLAQGLKADMRQESLTTRPCYHHSAHDGLSPMNESSNY